MKKENISLVSSKQSAENNFRPENKNIGYLSKDSSAQNSKTNWTKLYSDFLRVWIISNNTVHNNKEQQTRTEL